MFVIFMQQMRRQKNTNILRRIFKRDIYTKQLSYFEPITNKKQVHDIESKDKDIDKRQILLLCMQNNILTFNFECY